VVGDVGPIRRGARVGPLALGSFGSPYGKQPNWRGPRWTRTTYLRGNGA